MSNPDSGIAVDFDRTLGRVRPEIYGQFMSRRRWVVEDALHQPDHADADEFGNRRAVVGAVRKLAPPVIRWPGGCTGTSYEWERGIGPVTERSRTIDWHFGYDVSNDFGTAEFVRYCRSIGAEPQINLTTGTGTLREALNWLEYCNARHDSHYANLRRSHGYDEPFDVKYWQIGNEDWGAWEIGRVPAEEHARRCREWGRALHKLDPRVTVLAAGALRSDLAIDWNLPLLREAWDDLDYLCLHTYWRFDPTRPDGDFDRLIGVTDREEHSIRALRGLIELVARERDATRTPKLAFTEWNAANLLHNEMSPAWRPGECQYRMVDAVVCAAFLNVMQRQSDIVGLANFAQTINVVGALVVNQEDVVCESVYWPLWMQRNHSGPVAVEAQVDSPQVYCESWSGRPESTPALDVSATRDDAGTMLWLSVVNREKEAARNIELRLRGKQVAGTARRCELRAPSPLSRNTVAEPEVITPAWASVDLAAESVVSVPACSYTVFEIPLS